MLFKRLLFLGVGYGIFTPMVSVAGWRTPTIDSVGNVGQYPSIALDGSLNPHISYHDNTNLNLKYAKWTGVAWSTQTVDSVGNTGFYTSIALDGSGNPHISYLDLTNGDLRYAKWTGAAWQKQSVDSAGDVGHYSSIALDSSGNPNISYYDNTNLDLKYAKWTGAAWSTQTVDAAGNVGEFSSIKLDASGNPNISYYDRTNGDLKYAKWTGTAWSTQTVDSSGNVGGVPSLALDVSGNPHISYYDATNYSLKYTKWTGVVWQTQTVDSANTSSSMALDASGNPQISYYDFSASGLKYAKWIGAVWSTQTVDSGGSVGGWSSLALDISGNPNISYYDGTNGDLKYAQLNAAPIFEWTGETNYVADGLNQEVVSSTSSLVYRVKYRDSDNDAPKSGYPKLYILKAGTTVQALTMNLVSGAYNTGAIYSTSTVLSTLGTDYTYHFAAYDIWNDTATGAPTSEVDAPDVINNLPTLTWPGTSGYSSDGLNPESGDTAASFIYQIKYIDLDNTAPLAGYPKVHIKKSGVELSGSPYTMSFVSGAYNAGALYTYSKNLAAVGMDYTYYYEALDSTGAVATGAPTSAVDAPDVAEIIQPVIDQDGNKTTLGDNLFNPRAGGASKIKFTVTTAGRVSLKIYTLSGKLIRTLFEGDVASGVTQKDWDGKDDSGHYVAPSVYFLHYVYPGGKEVRKIGVKK